MIRQCSKCCMSEHKNKEATGSENSKHVRFDQLRRRLDYSRHGFVEFN